MSQRWTKGDDALLSAWLRDFEASDGEIRDDDGTAEIVAEKIGGTVLMSMDDYLGLVRANRSLYDQLVSAERIAEWARQDAKKAKRDSWFWCGMFWVAAVAYGALKLMGVV